MDPIEFEQFKPGVAGSNASDSTEIYAEGLCIASLKLYQAGALNRTIIKISPWRI